MNVRIGVVGVGHLGAIHAAVYHKMPDVDLVGVADIDAACARQVAERCACRAFTSGAELLDRAEAVSIAVPTADHRDVTLPFLKRGVHVLLEKPIAPGMAEGREIVDAAEQNGALLQIGHIERFNAGVMELARRVDNPRFIEAHRIGVFAHRATDVDVVIDLMVHDIDIVLTMVRSDIQYISAVGSPVLTPHVDIANARIEFSNGAIANFTVSRASDKRFRRIRVFGRDRYLALNFEDQQIEVARPVNGAGTEGDSGMVFPRVEREQIKVEPKPPLDMELRHFVDTVRSGGRPLVNGHDGLAVLEVAHQVKAKIAATCDDAIVPSPQRRRSQ